MAEKKEAMMAPPVWKMETTTYENWRFDVTLWTKFSKAEKKRMGFLLYSVLPTEKGVNEKVRLAMQNGEIQIEGDDAVEQIFEVLDKWYKKDDLSMVCDVWCSYKNLQKKENGSMEDFMNEYERKVKELKKEKVDLPDVVLAMQLLDCAGIEKKDKKI